MEMDEKVDMLRSFQDPGQCRPDPIKPEWLDAALSPVLWFAAGVQLGWLAAGPLKTVQ